MLLQKLIGFFFRYFTAIELLCTLGSIRDTPVKTILFFSFGKLFWLDCILFDFLCRPVNVAYTVDYHMDNRR